MTPRPLSPFSCNPILGALVLSALVGAGDARATQPPAGGAAFPSAYFDRAKADPRAFTYRRALHEVAARALTARAAAGSPLLAPIGTPGPFAVEMNKIFGVSPGESPALRVQGERRVPVLMSLFKDAKAEPYRIANLQRQLFDGPWPTGTMSDYYREVSSGALTVTGTVHPWIRLPQTSSHYEGPPFVSDQGVLEPCKGLCRGSRMAEFISDVLAAAPAVDWGQFDNDGPDGIANSGDDDGFVDFVAFVQGEIGGECSEAGTRHLWSHRYNLSFLGGVEHTTSSPRKGGGFIKIDDYVVMPALACDGSTMIQIGVFAHEFGHAFGLPDLYDTDTTNGRSGGLGSWCLMASGAWGGDGQHPERPTHLSPWAKNFLGWLDVEEIDHDQASVAIPAIDSSRKAFKLSVSSKIHYLLNGVRRSGFNADLFAEGLQIWKINDTVVKAGLPSNRVNADAANPGVKLIQADGLDQLLKPDFRGGPGDLFPGSSLKTSFDSVGKPSSLGTLAVCNITWSANQGSARVLRTGNRCQSEGMPIAAAASPAAPSAAPAASAASSLTVAQAMPSGSTVTVSGTLMNVGANYFDRRSRRIVLVDDEGRELDVVPNVPLESAPAASGTPPSASGALSSYLDKRVEVTGTLQRDAADPLRMRVQATSLTLK